MSPTQKRNHSRNWHIAIGVCAVHTTRNSPDPGGNMLAGAAGDQPHNNASRQSPAHGMERLGGVRLARL
jgi:hypothetical protein